MRTFIKLGIIGLFLIVGAMQTASTPIKAEFAESENSSSRSLYVQNCARCHGADGKAETTLGQRLEAADLTSGNVQSMDPEKLIRAIKNGRPNMPAFGKKLTPKQISSIAAYVRSL